jgi:dihydroceramide fatty acyl 2-hydroxylase
MSSVEVSTEVRREVDLSKPILGQVGALGPDYMTWVHKSVSPKAAKQANAALVESSDPVASRWPESLRIFESSFLESMSHIKWWTIPIFWIPIISALLFGAIRWAGLPLAEAWVWAVLGLFLWTLTEYSLHRFVFHFPVKRPFGCRLHFLMHGIHHLDPWDGTRLVFPPLGGLIVASIIFGILWIPLPLAKALATMAGLLGGYIVYDMTHYATHHKKMKSAVGKFLKKYHLAHHHKFPERLYGITQPLWDIVFRTGRP